MNQKIIISEPPRPSLSSDGFSPLATNSITNSDNSNSDCDSKDFEYDNPTYDFGNGVDFSPLAPSSMSLIPTPNEFPTATPFVIPDLTPTVTPQGSPTVSQTVNSTVTFAKTDPHLGSDYETDEDSGHDPSSLFQPTSTAPWTPSMQAQIFISSIPPRAPAIFGGDSNEDLYDYSDDEGSSCFESDLDDSTSSEQYDREFEAPY